MVEPTRLEKLGVTPGKLALVATLAIVLIGVIAYQFSNGGAPSREVEFAGRRSKRVGGSGDVPNPRTPGARQNINATAPPTQVRSSAGNPLTTDIKIARPEPLRLEDILAHDPFRMPAAFVAAMDSGTDDPAPLTPVPTDPLVSRTRTLDVAAAVERLRAGGVVAVIHNGEETMAALGNRVVRIGDMIEGLQVVEIRPDGTVTLK